MGTRERGRAGPGGRPEHLMIARASALSRRRAAAVRGGSATTALPQRDAASRTCLTSHARSDCLGGAQLAVVASGVGAVLLAVGIAFMPTWQEVYVREAALPRIAGRYGFEMGAVTFSRATVTHASPGILSLDPDGALARMGVRRGDVPFAHHGNGAPAMYHALMAAEHGRAADFDVFNADDWSGGRDRQAFRTIQVPARGRAR